MVVVRQAARKILIIESQLIIAADISLQLLKLGYEVVGICTPSDDTMKTIRSCRPDLVLMNIKMYGIECKIEMARTFMQDLGLPVIFISAHTNQEVLLQVMSAQPYAFVPKPFAARDLERGLKTAFDRLKSERLWMPVYHVDHEPGVGNCHLSRIAAWKGSIATRIRSAATRTRALKVINPGSKFKMKVS